MPSGMTGRSKEMMEKAGELLKEATYFKFLENFKKITD